MLTGASQPKIIAFAVAPTLFPAGIGGAVHVRVQHSLVDRARVVGAGGIGQQLKNAIELPDFPRVLTIVVVMLSMVTAVDQLSSRLRRGMA